MASSARSSTTRTPPLPSSAASPSPSVGSITRLIASSSAASVLATRPTSLLLRHRRLCPAHGVRPDAREHGHQRRCPLACQLRVRHVPPSSSRVWDSRNGGVLFDFTEDMRDPRGSLCATRCATLVVLGPSSHRSRSPPCWTGATPCSSLMTMMPTPCVTV
jgi:hypothetical protein